MTSHLFDDRKGAEKVDGVAALVGVADELSVQLLVTSKGDASSLLVVILKMRKAYFYPQIPWNLMNPVQYVIFKNVNFDKNETL